jgi:hypothetical protein
MTHSEPEDALIHLTLNVTAGMDLDECDLLTRELRADLRELGVESVEFISDGNAPTGSKAAVPFVVGALSVAVAPAALPQLAEYLQGWTTRAENRRIGVKAQIGDRSVEMNFTPSNRVQDQMDKLLGR